MKKKTPTVLICPLDWGLGHASRMIPVIDGFRENGFQVLLGGSGRSGELLKSSFPELSFIPLPSPVIHYGTGSSLIPTLLLQLPLLIRAAFREHRLIKKVVKKYSVDILISDNRYGLFCRDAHSIIVTHQLSPVLPRLMRWLEYPLHLLIKSIIRQFDECWIPDWADNEHNLSGKLSHRFTLPRNASYIGILSRFKADPIGQFAGPEATYDLAVVLSGPEPQASILDNLIRTQLSRIAIKSIIISGMREPVLSSQEPHQPLLTVVPHLPPPEFRKTLAASKTILCRSGYSGIMDLVTLGRTAVLIPTPGQSEQEYLAEYLSEKGWFRYYRQQEFDLASAIDLMEKGPPASIVLLSEEKEKIPLLSGLYHKYDEYGNHSQGKT